MTPKLFSNKLLFASYVTLLLLFVTLPLNSSGNLNNITIITFRGDYFFHALAFLPWAFFRAFTHQKRLYWLIIGIFFATSTEALQYLLPYRAYNVNDMIANMIGVLIGYGIALGFLNSKISNSKI